MLWRAVVGWYARLCRGAVGGATVGRVAFIPPLGMVVALTTGGALKKKTYGAQRAGEEDVWTDVFAHLCREGPSSLVVRSTARIF